MKLKRYKNFKVNESNEEDLTFEDIVDVEKLRDFAKSLHLICLGNEGYTYYNPDEMKIAISLGDNNQIRLEGLKEWINETIFKDYSNKDKINIEIDNEWIPGKEGWFIFNLYKNREKFIEA